MVIANLESTTVLALNRLTPALVVVQENEEKQYATRARASRPHNGGNMEFQSDLLLPRIGHQCESIFLL
jgi:hypothetical protein